MRGQSRRRQSSSLPYRIPLWGAVLIVAVLLYLNNSPMILGADEASKAGRPVDRTSPSDIVVLLDYRAIHDSPSTFSGRDWSAAWIDLLEQHVGPISVVTPKSLKAKHLEQARLVVLTASVSDKVPDQMRTQLREFALGGNLLVVERPEGKLREMFAANGAAGEQVGRQITYAEGIQDPYKEQLTEIPLQTEYVGSTSPKKGAETLMAIDGAPAIYGAPVGDGAVVTVDFDLGQQLVAMQQGRPGEQFRVAPERDGQLPPRTEDLVAHEEMEGSTVPGADLLERFIVYGVLQRYTPMPGLWTFPGDAKGVVVPLHEDETLGDGGGWMLEYEASRDATSTLLASVDSGLTAAGAAVVDRRGGEVGLLWKKAGTPAQQTEAYGIGGIHPVAQPLSLKTQVERMAAKLPSERIWTVKTAGRWWDRRWAAPFRAMSQVGLAVDTSYEPRKIGYAFGTGFAFRTLDRTGLPLGVREMPVVVPARPSDELSLESLLKTSRDGHHQVIPYSLAPSSFGEYPDMQRFEKWVDSFEVIRRTGHVIRNTEQWLGFWRARLRSSLTSQVIRQVAIPSDGPSAQKEAAESGTGKGTLLRISADIERKDISLVVPQSIGERTFLEARQRASRVAGNLVARKLETDRETIVGFPVRRLPVDAGSTRIDVYYR